MSKVTSKYQVTLPKALARKYNIRPGDDIDWVSAGETIRVIPSGIQDTAEDRESRLRLFDQATERLRTRTTARRSSPSTARGWKREDLYKRGRSH